MVFFPVRSRHRNSFSIDRCKMLIVVDKYSIRACIIEDCPQFVGDAIFSNDEFVEMFFFVCIVWRNFVTTTMVKVSKECSSLASEEYLLHHLSLCFCMYTFNNNFTWQLKNNNCKVFNW